MRFLLLVDAGSDRDLRAALMRGHVSREGGNPARQECRDEQNRRFCVVSRSHRLAMRRPNKILEAQPTMEMIEFVVRCRKAKDEDNGPHAKCDELLLPFTCISHASLANPCQLDPSAHILGRELLWRPIFVCICEIEDVSTRILESRRRLVNAIKNESWYVRSSESRLRARRATLMARGSVNTMQ